MIEDDYRPKIFEMKYLNKNPYLQLLLLEFHLYFFARKIMKLDYIFVVDLADYYFQNEKFPDAKINDEFKKKQCDEKGIKLITVWEQDWINNVPRMRDVLRAV